MKIKDKINLDRDGLVKYGPITIVAFGDSLTHGALGSDEFNYDTVYWNRLRNKILSIRSYVPVNVINAGIGGTTAKESIERMDRQVLAYNPDLIIICFGLNDVNGLLDEYLDSLSIIFEKALASEAELIFMTPNMLNTYVSDDTPKHIEYAAATAKMQNEGKMDLYMEKAIALAEDMNVTVCDCYGKWKELSKTEDITMLLANRINHPTKEMHEVFAQSLFEIIFPDSNEVIRSNESAMYKG